MQERIRIVDAHDVAELSEELIVLGSSDTRPAKSEVERIIQELMIVGSEIEDDGQDPRRINPYDSPSVYKPFTSDRDSPAPMV